MKIEMTTSDHHWSCFFFFSRSLSLSPFLSLNILRCIVTRHTCFSRCIGIHVYILSFFTLVRLRCRCVYVSILLCMLAHLYTTCNERETKIVLRKWPLVMFHSNQNRTLGNIMEYLALLTKLKWTNSTKLKYNSTKQKTRWKIQNKWIICMNKIYIYIYTYKNKQTTLTTAQNHHQQ